MYTKQLSWNWSANAHKKRHYDDFYFFVIYFWCTFKNIITSEDMILPLFIFTILFLLSSFSITFISKCQFNCRFDKAKNVYKKSLLKKKEKKTHSIAIDWYWKAYRLKTVCGVFSCNNNLCDICAFWFYFWSSYRSQTRNYYHTFIIFSMKFFIITLCIYFMHVMCVTNLNLRPKSAFLS